MQQAFIDEEDEDDINVLDARYKNVYVQCKTDEIRSKLRELNGTERHELVSRKHNDDDDSPMFVFVRREVEKLLKDEMDTNLNNRVYDDILRMSCLVGHEIAFQYLMENVEYSVETRANAHEIMGAFYVSEEEQGDIFEILKHWKEALRIRQDNGLQITEQIPFNPVPIGHQMELDSEAELDRIAWSRQAIIIQAVYITRRILGIHDQFTFGVECNLNQSYYDNRQFVGDIKLTMYQVNRVVNNDGLHSNAAYEMAYIGVVMFIDYARRIGVDHELLKFDDVVLVVNILSAQMERPNVNKETLNLLTKMLDVLFRMPKNESEQLIFKNLTRTIVQKKFCDHKRRSMLHIFASNPLPKCTVGYPYFNYQIPQAPFVQFLVDCGHYVDALDDSKSSPLHLATGNGHYEDVVNCLIENGAHIDRANVDGFRPCQLLDTVVPGLDTFRHVTLQCLAARTIVNCRVPYNVISISRLVAFIEMH